MSDITNISQRLQDIKRQTEEGFYGEITDATLVNNDETIALSIDYPEGSGEYRLSIPQYWESGRELVDFLSYVELGPNSFDKITNRALPVSRVNGSWQIDSTRLQNRDYKVISSILTFAVTDNTKNDNTSFDIAYDVTENDSFDHLEVDIDNQANNWADAHYTLSGFSGTNSDYNQGSVTDNQYTITLQVIDTDGNVTESESTTLTTGN